MKAEIHHGRHVRQTRPHSAERAPGMSIEAIEAALLAVNRTQCKRPGPEQNIIRIARSAEKWRR
jgi:hypothetical protein